MHRCSSLFTAAAAGPNLWSRDRKCRLGGSEYALSCRVDDGEPVQVAAGPATIWRWHCVHGRRRKVAAVAPGEGQLAVRTLRSDRNQSSSFSLGGLKLVREGWLWRANGASPG